MTNTPPPDETDSGVPEWVKVIPGLDPAVEGVVDRLHLASRYLDRLAADCAAPQGLSSADYEILARLYWVGPPHQLTPTQLAAGTLSPATTITSRLERLQKAGLIIRSVSGSDRRSTPAELNEEGQRIFLSVVTEQARREREAIAPLGEQDLAELENLLRRLMFVLEQSLGPAPRRTRLAQDATARRGK
ncbi:MarR family winged helix-turn-helix transcriptional regulator [Crossiella sp. NPDC003009]